jgi:hypothetical protein
MSAFALSLIIIVVLIGVLVEGHFPVGLAKATVTHT